MDRDSVQSFAIVDIADLRSRSPRIKRGGRFLSGQIPWNWLSACACLPGKALHVGIALWLWRGIKKSYRVKLSVKGLEELGVSRHAAYRALKVIEERGLASVERHRGRSPRVTLLDVPEDC